MTVAPVARATGIASPMWSSWACVTRIRSSSPMLLLSASGHDGFASRNGSTRIRFPPGERKRNVAWPSQVNDRAPLGDGVTSELLKRRRPRGPTSLTYPTQVTYLTYPTQLTCLTYLTYPTYPTCLTSLTYPYLPRSQ